MLKQFIACANNQMRLKFLRETVIGDWSSIELDAVGDILDIDIRTENDMTKKYTAICNELEARMKVA